jgi:hypothetical protein
MYLDYVCKSDAALNAAPLPTHFFPTTLQAPVPLSQKTYSFRTQRGRSYELGSLEAGLLDVQVDNSDGTFDPVSNPQNTTVYAPITLMTAYPKTGNILNDTNTAVARDSNAPNGPDQYRIAVSANDGNFESGISTLNWYKPAWLSNTATPTYPLTTVDPTHYVIGSQSLQLVGPASGAQCFYALDVPTIAGQQMTFSAYVRGPSVSGSVTEMSVFDGGLARNLTPRTSPTVQTYLTTGTSFVRYSLTWTPNGSKATISFTVAGANQTIQIDGCQLEFGSAPTTYTSTGPEINYLFNGFVERYPETYQAPNRGESLMSSVDVVAQLSNLNVKTPFYQRVINLPLTNRTTDTGQYPCLVPLYYYPLDEPSGSTYSVNQSAYGQPNLVPYVKETSSIAWGVSTTDLLGIENPPVLAPAQVSGSYAYLYTDEVNDLSSQYPPIFTGMVKWLADSGWLMRVQYSDGTIVSLNISAGGVLSLATTNGTMTRNSGPNITLTSGQWYMFSLQQHHSTYGTEMNYYLNLYNGDGVTYSFTLNDYSLTGVTTTTAPEIKQFSIGGFTGFMSQFTVCRTPDEVSSPPAFNFDTNGYFPELDTLTALAKNSVKGETTGNRFASILSQYAGLTNIPYAVDLGSTTVTTMNFNNTKLIDQLQRLVDTEGGEFYVDGQGFITMRSRTRRLKNVTPKYVFGENTASGEIPFDADKMVLSFDPSYIINQVEIDRDGASPYIAYDTASQRVYFPRSFTRATYTQSEADTHDMANYILSRYKNPHARVEQIVLTPARNPSAWSSCLGVEIGDLVTVKRRPLGASAISVDCFVDRIEHQFDAQTADWITTLSLSPAIFKYWVLDNSACSILDAYDTTSLSLGVVSTSPTINRLFLDVQSETVNTLRADLAIGQLLSVQDNTGAWQTCGVVGIDGTSGTTQNVSVMAVADSGMKLNTALSVSATSVSLSKASPAGITAILIDQEWMQVNSGAGTSTLSVTRGTPLTSTYPSPLTLASHASGVSVYYRVNTGLSGSFNDNFAVTDGVGVQGTTRIGY